MSPRARRPLSFGISVTPYADAYPDLVAQVRAAERAGLELVGIQDHPYQRRYLDTFALIGDLLARTERLVLFPDVANLPLRPPAMLAKQVASLDRMSGGRFELGLGSGSYWQAIVGMGGPSRTPREAFEALAEAIGILRAALDGEPVVRGGRHHPIPGYPPGPPPAHRVGIWLGVYGKRGLRLAGRAADGWVPSSGRMGPERLAAASAIVDEAALEAGRDPAEIRRLYNLWGEITDGRVGDGPLHGPVDLWVERLTRWANELAVDTFLFWPPDRGTDQVERFAAEIVPAVRAAFDGRTQD